MNVCEFKRVLCHFNSALCSVKNNKSTSATSTNTVAEDRPNVRISVHI